MQGPSPEEQYTPGIVWSALNACERMTGLILVVKIHNQYYTLAELHDIILLRL
jgi:hypothetical protein